MCRPSTPTHSVAAIHGRFQPFHSGHMQYLLLALAQTDSLFVGVTNPDAPLGGVAEATDPARHHPHNNPLTYAQRRTLILAAVRAHVPRISTSRITIVPFDVSGNPNTWSATIPLRAVQLVAPHDEWDREKAERFARAGYAVDYLPTQENRVTATQVRALIRSGDSRWRNLLPSGVIRALEELDLIDSIRRAPADLYNYPESEQEDNE